MIPLDVSWDPLCSTEIVLSPANIAVTTSYDVSRHRVLLVGERWNSDELTRWDCETALRDPHRWLEVSRRLGAYGTGVSGKYHAFDHNLRRLGIEPREHYHDALNLLPPSPVAGAWDAQVADVVGNALVDLNTAAHASYCEDGLLARWRFDVLLVLGRRVERALSHDTEKFFEPVLTAGGRVVKIVLPHPSGRSRFWNEKSRVIAGRDRLREVFRWLEFNSTTKP